MPLFRNTASSGASPIGFKAPTAATDATLSVSTRPKSMINREVMYPKCAGRNQDEILNERLEKRKDIVYHHPETRKRVLETLDEDGRVVRTVGFRLEQERKEREEKEAEEKRLAASAAAATTSMKTLVDAEGSDARAPDGCDEEAAGRVIVGRMPPSARGKIYFEVETDGATRHESTGIVIIDVHQNKIMMYDRAGRQHGNRPEPGYDLKEADAQNAAPNVTLKVGAKSVRLVTALHEDMFRSGEFFLHAEHEQKKREDVKKAKEAAVAAKVQVAAKMSFGCTGLGALFNAPVFRKRPRDGESGFIVPIAGRSSRSGGVGSCLVEMKALHDHDREGAVVLHRANYKRDINGRAIVSVVVDPIIGDKLRPHQRIGVQFLFDCITGERMPGYFGAILADEMGLGKTIQTVATVFTCLKQGKHGIPVARKAVVVAPSSLVTNWCNEFDKWLGPGAVQCFAISESTPKGDRILSRFEGPEGEVLVISYDQLRKYVDRLSKMTSIELVVCDEGHRLKNAEIKTTKAVDCLPTKRRIILSGTPIQNDLSEFHAMVGFVNPGILGNRDLFNRVFEEPIMAGRDPDQPEYIKELGADRAHYLANLTAKFILRRTQTINEKYLPAKVDITVFVRLGEMQCMIYKRVIELVERLSSTPLVLITALKKLCNHIDLFRDALRDGETNGIPKSILPKGFQTGQLNHSVGSKMQFVSLMLDELKSNGDRDKLVIVSNYTQTLEIIANLCATKKVSYFQLDGSTPIKKRQELVDRFNVPTAQEIVFLLSSKAGGVGLNLIGANRLILFDSDWNPANDAQAMGRVWRDGQKKKVFIYRMLCTGTIEEKIFQRQVSKQGLSANVVDMKDDSKQHFSSEELKSLFAFRPETLSDTHDLLLCDCNAPRAKEKKAEAPTLKFRKVGVPGEAAGPRTGPRMDELNSWMHISDIASFTLDKVLCAMSRREKDLVSFAFANERDAKKYEAIQEVAVERPFVADEGLITCMSQSGTGAEDAVEIEVFNVDDDDDDE